MSKLGQTHGIVEKTYQDTIGHNFRLRGAKIVEIPQFKGWLAKQSPNQGFKMYVFLKLAYILRGKSNLGDTKYVGKNKHGIIMLGK